MIRRATAPTRQCDHGSAIERVILLVLRGEPVAGPNTAGTAPKRPCQGSPSQDRSAREYDLMTDLEASSDARLLASTDQAAEAFGAFYRRHVDLVIRYVAVRIESHEIVGDIVAEVFAAALLARERFDPAKGTGAEWLLGIASHKVVDAQRRGHAERRLQERLRMTAIAWTEEDFERIERLSGQGEPAALDLLAALPADQRDALKRRVIGEHSYADIARAASSSESVIRQRVSRGLATLRAWIGEQQ